MLVPTTSIKALQFGLLAGGIIVCALFINTLNYWTIIYWPGLPKLIVVLVDYDCWENRLRPYSLGGLLWSVGIPNTFWPCKSSRL